MSLNGNTSQSALSKLFSANGVESEAIEFEPIRLNLGARAVEL